MILAVAFLLCILPVPLLGGRFSRLAALRVTRHWTILAALVIQVVIISIIPGDLPSGVGPALHLGSYALTLLFIVANRRIRGMVILTIGGLANLVAIGANGGVMPASEAALRLAGRTPPPGEFINSEVQEGAHLLFLGDILALPAWMPFANVFSVGDVLLVVGGAVVVHRSAGTGLPFRKRSGTGSDDGITGRDGERTLEPVAVTGPSSSV